MRKIMIFPAIWLFSVFIIASFLIVYKSKYHKKAHRHQTISFYRIDEYGNCITDSSIKSSSGTLLASLPDSFSILTSISKRKEIEEEQSLQCYIVIGSIFDKYANVNIYTSGWYSGEMPPEKFVTKQIWNSVKRDSLRYSKSSIMIVNIMRMNKQELKSYIGCTKYKSTGITDKDFCNE